MTHVTVSTMNYPHPPFSTRWVTMHNSANPAQKRATFWRKLNKMCRFPCFYLFQFVLRNMAPDNPASLHGWATYTAATVTRLDGGAVVRNDVIANGISPKIWQQFAFIAHSLHHSSTTSNLLPSSLPPHQPKSPYNQQTVGLELTLLCNIQPLTLASPNFPTTLLKYSEATLWSTANKLAYSITGYHAWVGS